MSELHGTEHVPHADRAALAEFAQRIRAACGMAFGPERMQWLHTRLAEAAGTAGLAEMLRGVQGADLASTVRMQRIVESVVTDKSSWFRYPEHFALLRDYVLPAVAESRQAEGGGTVRILSAGCSRGQEPYSIALAIEATEDLPRGVSWQVDAVDLSQRNIDYATAGLYAADELEGLDEEQVLRCFERRGDRWRLRDAHRRDVSFRQHNLLHPLPPASYDIVFCRNVTIYFDAATTREVLLGLLSRLRPGGYFFCGHAESYRDADLPVRLLELGGTLVYRKQHQTFTRSART